MIGHNHTGRIRLFEVLQSADLETNPHSFQGVEYVLRIPGPTARAPGQRKTLVGHIISLLLYQPELVSLISEPEALSEHPDAGTAFLRELVEFLQSRPQIRFAGILEHWRDSRYEPRLKALAIAGVDILPELEDLESEIIDAWSRLLEQKRKHIRQKSTTVNRMSDLTEAEKAELRALSNRQSLSPEK